MLIALSIVLVRYFSYLKLLELAIVSFENNLSLQIIACLLDKVELIVYFLSWRLIVQVVFILNIKRIRNEFEILKATTETYFYGLSQFEIRYLDVVYCNMFDIIWKAEQECFNLSFRICLAV